MKIQNRDNRIFRATANEEITVALARERTALSVAYDRDGQSGAFQPNQPERFKVTKDIKLGIHFIFSSPQDGGIYSVGIAGKSGEDVFVEIIRQGSAPDTTRVYTFNL